ncbi:MAG TPA: hypothetical protein VJ784_01340 [Pyrinomonadaceae bacterium]|nr:hypothetical protein [Pyrinomonadaceae bacterium]
MNKLRRTGAIVTLSLTLAVSAFAGTIHAPGKAEPPPKDQTTSTTSISTTTTMILTIISLIRY